MLPAYILKHKLACEKQIIFFMIPNEEKKKALSCNIKIICIIT